MTARRMPPRSPTWIRPAAVAAALAWFAGLTAAFRVQPMPHGPGPVPVRRVRYIPRAGAADDERDDRIQRLVGSPTLFALPSAAGFSRPFLEDTAKTPLPAIRPDPAAVSPVPAAAPVHPPVYRVKARPDARSAPPPAPTSRLPVLSVQTHPETSPADTEALAALLPKENLGEAPWTCDVTVSFGPDGVPRHVILGPGPGSAELRDHLVRQFYRWRIVPSAARVERHIRLSYAGAHRPAAADTETAP